MEKIRIKAPSEVFPLIAKYRNKEQEYFGVVIMDNAHQVKSVDVLFIGGVAKTLVDMRPIAWKLASGICVPSKNDDDTTQSVNRLCTVMGIQFLDHIIIGKDTLEMYSYREDDYNFEKDVKDLFISLDK